jgi:dGTPase
MTEDVGQPIFPPGPAPYASLPERSRGRLTAEPDSPTRTCFQRDRDRIVHAGAFRKLEYKTQVFVYHEGDYYRTRLTHSLEVAQIARSLCRSLRLNEDLGEAVALAHDLGHTPFGHAGERALNRCMAPYGGFSHNDQSLRVLTRLEQRYAEFDGLNLTWETLEGVVKHNGPLLPLKVGQTLPVTIREMDARWSLELDTWAGPEAQIAALADDVAYNNHDLDDGLRAGMFTIDEIAQLPLLDAIVAEVRGRYPGLGGKRLVNEIVRRLIDLMIADLRAETARRLAGLAPSRVEEIRAAPHAVVAFSPAIEEAQVPLREFLTRRMYRHYRVNREMSKCRRVVEALFALFLAEPETLPPRWQDEIRASGGADETVRARVVADYIAGMTDRYALIEYSRLFDIDSQDLRA